MIFVERLFLVWLFVFFSFQCCSNIKRSNGKIAFSRVMNSGNIELFLMSPDGKHINVEYNPTINVHPGQVGPGQLNRLTVLKRELPIPSVKVTTMEPSKLGVILV